MSEKEIIVTKATGEQSAFEESRLRRSLERSGASKEVIQQVVEEVEDLLYDGITTKEIYKKAFALLRKTSRPTAARYKLKKAIYELGPSGFPFEQFVAAILRNEGFKTKTDVIIKGLCVNHEVDVVAEKGDEHYIVECKFHGDQGRFCDVKVPLYIHSRFNDIGNQWEQHPDNDGKIQQGWIYTNTRFTLDAIQYANCAGLKLVGWDHPAGGSLKEKIDAAGLHPVTCLTTITNYEKRKLLDNDVVLCRELIDRPKVLKKIGIHEERHKNVLEEAKALCTVIP